MRHLYLPAMTDDIVVAPAHAHVLTDSDDPNRHRFHISAAPTPHAWQWAHLLRAVSGWKVIAAGVLSDGQCHTAAEASEEIARRFLGGSGDGFDRLPVDRYVQVGGSTVACLLRESRGATYCEKTGGQQAVFDTAVKGHATQHCIHCGGSYRAEHYGRMALPV